MTIDHIPATPNREPLLNELHALPPELPGSFVARETIWAANSEEPGQHWHTIYTPDNLPGFPSNADYLKIEHVARSGMREVFEAAGLYTRYVQRADTETFRSPVLVHESVFVFPSQDPLQRNIHALVAGFPEDTRFTFSSTGVARKFAGTEWVPALAAKKLLLSADSPDPNPSLFDLSYPQHDLRMHVPAWLCMPPLVTTRVFEAARDAVAEYDRVQASWYDDCSDREAHIYFARMAAAKQRISDLTGEFDLINIMQINRLLRGEEKEALTPMLSKMLGGTAGMYKTAILEHIANPRRENLLVAVAS